MSFSIPAFGDVVNLDFFTGVEFLAVLLYYENIGSLDAHQFWNQKEHQEAKSEYYHYHYR